MKAVQRFGIVFHSRQPENIKVKFVRLISMIFFCFVNFWNVNFFVQQKLEEEREYQVLNLLEFNRLIYFY